MENRVYKINNDVEADNFISSIREQLAERARLEMIYKARIDQLKADYERQVTIIDKDVDFSKAMLRAYFLTVKSKELKTMSKYKLLSGELIMKKSTTKLVHEDEKILEYLQSEGNKEYTKNIPKLDWTKFKDNLIIQDNGVITTKDGEVLEVEGLKIENVPEVFEIKL